MILIMFHFFITKLELMAYTMYVLYKGVIHTTPLWHNFNHFYLEALKHGRNCNAQAHVIFVAPSLIEFHSAQDIFHREIDIERCPHCYSLISQ